MNANFKKPNVLFILVDCLRGDKVFENKGKASLGFLQDKASAGVRFPYTYTSASSTIPNIASLFTSKYPFEHGVRVHRGRRLNLDLSTMAEIFRDSGYLTHAEVSGPLGRELGFDRGFDIYNYRDRTETLINKRGTTEYFDRLKNKIKKGGLKEPWFLFLHVWALHKPRQVIGRFDSNEYGRTKYERTLSSLNWALKDLFSVLKGDTMVVLHGDHGERVTHKTSQRMLEGIVFRFRSVKRFFKNLEVTTKLFQKKGRQSNLLQRAVGHGFHLYDYLIRPPFYLMGKIPPKYQNKTIKNPVYQIDILPTLVDLLNLEFNNKEYPFTGRSLIPYLEGRQVSFRDLYLEAGGMFATSDRHRLYGLRTKDFKFVYNPYNKEIEDQLYEIQDGEERRGKNLATDRPEVVKKMKKKTKRIQERTVKREKKGKQLSKNEERKVKERLRDLGYL